MTSHRVAEDIEHSASSIRWHLMSNPGVSGFILRCGWVSLIGRDGSRRESGFSPVSAPTFWKMSDGARPTRGRCSFRLFNDLIGPEQKRFGQRETDTPGGIQICHQLEFCGLFDRQIGGLRSLQYLVHKGRGSEIEVGIVDAVRERPPSSTSSRVAYMAGSLCLLARPVINRRFA